MPEKHARWDVYELHATTIQRYVARRVEPDAVDDIVAETFATAWRRLPRDVDPPVGCCRGSTRSPDA